MHLVHGENVNSCSPETITIKNIQCKVVPIRTRQVKHYVLPTEVDKRIPNAGVKWTTADVRQGRVAVQLFVCLFVL